jgi:hypothetical protein
MAEKLAVGSEAWVASMAERLAAEVTALGFTNAGRKTGKRETFTVNAAVVKLAAEFKAARRN